ncbi:extracellular solute-binding protein [Anaerocolumna sp. MB42-C2]|uniref:extracellular solute-binding protein n=1 Tax=Anaerocolumna sp. MB42-C2 TaxID=3070997 RepID=UPI0027E16D45|nr:extracellular solute-binding protein [Anaerocolumna sp. MB42-C2]WMJ86275.1 extracellular solute-binding protein [Anaerocolumna sp. MB42-C2]
MQNKKAILSFILASALLFAGCSQNGGDNKETAAVKNVDGKYDPTITITIAKQLDENTGRYGDGEDINKNPMMELAEKKLGIRMETTLLGGDANNYDTKLRLALTGSEELPDVFPVYGTQMIADMIESGHVKAIDDDIEKYMPERLKKIYDKYPQSFYPVTKDGKTYGIACAPALTEGQVMIIRQDWLDKLGLQAPTNMDEFEAVIKAFTEDDPDGNGKNDTYGFTYTGNDIYSSGWVADPVILFSANSGKHIPGSWQEDTDGNLTYGSIDKGNKKTLERMAGWHASRWIFQEAAATGAWDAMNQFTEGKAGIFIGRPWAIDSVRDVTSVAPDAVIKAYPNILQDNKEPTYQSAQINDGWLMFNKNFNYMEAFFNYYDWLYDAAFGTGDFQYGYLEGYDYDIVDGKVLFDSKLFEPAVTDPFMPGKSTVLKNSPALDTMQDYADVSEKKEAETSAQIRAKAAFETTPDTAEGYVTANGHRDELLPNLFNGEPTPTMKKNWEQLQTMEKQVYTNIIYGKESPDAFDKFVQDWKAQGGDEITKEVNEWYQSVK